MKVAKTQPAQVQQYPAHESDPWAQSNAIANWILVVIGAVASGLAVMSLGATRKAADAAKESADFLMLAERPWVTVASIEDGTMPHYVESVTIDVVQWEVTNIGKTPAIIIQTGGTVETLPIDNPLPVVPVYVHKSDRPEYFLPVGGKARCVPIPVGTGRRIIEDWRQIAAKTHAIYAYGFVRYSDPFEKEHEMRFCYRIAEPQGSTWKRYGDRAYNKHT